MHRSRTGPAAHLVTTREGEVPGFTLYRIDLLFAIKAHVAHNDHTETQLNPDERVLLAASPQNRNRGSANSSRPAGGSCPLDAGRTCAGGASPFPGAHHLVNRTRRAG